MKAGPGQARAWPKFIPLSTKPVQWLSVHVAGAWPMPMTGYTTGAEYYHNTSL